MKGVGIVSEYNPLHKGHEYHIKNAKASSGADIAVAVMSGNFVQRGELAILSKWDRARHAIEAGADVVIELPTYFALSDAGRFAKAGISIIKATGLCDSFAFGSEVGDTDALKMVSSRIEDEAFKEVMQAFVKNGLTYAKARSETYKNLYPEDQKSLEILSSPNDILGLSYINAAKGIEPITIKRLGAGYNDDLQRDEIFQSATAIRKETALGNLFDEDLKNSISEFVFSDLEALSKQNFLEERNKKIFDMVRLILLTSSCAELEDCPSAGEGITNRLKQAAKTSKNLDELILNTKTKRYTYTRISRLLMQILLNIKRSDFEAGNQPKDIFENPRYLRILGLSEKGRASVAYATKEELNTAPFITNINKSSEILDFAGDNLLALDNRAADVYNLICESDIYKNSDFVKYPYIK